MSTGFHYISIKPVIEIVYNENVLLGGIEESAASANEASVT